MRYEVRIPEEAYNKAFLCMREDWHRITILYGGAGSGKSYTVAQILIERMLCEKNYNVLVVRNTGRSNRDSTFALLKQIISKWSVERLFIVNSSDMRIKCINGNEIIFSGLDDVEKLKSVTFSKGELGSIWIEEASEITEADFNQLNIRLRGNDAKHQIWITFNPIDINHWIKHRFFDGKVDYVVIHKSTYLDNDHLDDEYKRVLESYKDTDPYYYSVYALGEWGVLGSSIFDANAISNRLHNLPVPVQIGYFNYFYDGLKVSDIRWCQDTTNGYITIYKKPEKNHKYVIGGDTAGDGSDYFVSQVLDAATGEQVAKLRHQMDSDQYTRMTYCLGMYYNYALLTIEVNFDMYPIKELERLGYTNMFIREMQDTFTGGIKKAYGFRTDSMTRPRIISQLVEIVREHTELFNDRQTLEEMLTFVRNDKGRPEAQQGAHDDSVMSIAIAHEGRQQVVFWNEPPKESYNEEEEIFNYGN